MTSIEDYEGDDFDKPPVIDHRGVIYLAHPEDAMSFPRSIEYTDPRLPRGRIYVMSSTDERSIEQFVSDMILENGFRYHGFARQSLEKYAEQGDHRRYAPAAFEALDIVLDQLAQHRDESWVVYTEGLISGTLRKHIR